jgi:hypothetical protein
MSTATVRIPEEKKDLLLTGLIDEYIERHKETLNLLSNPKWVEVIKKGKKEVAEEVKGKTLDELED